jgi:hypothetical protein
LEKKMLNEKQMRLLSSIHDKAVNGKLKWIEGASDKSFTTSFPDSTIMISEEHNRANGSDDYVFRVLNSDANTVIEINDMEVSSFTNGDGYYYLAQIYQSARESAYNIDGIIDGIFKKLNEE